MRSSLLNKVRIVLTLIAGFVIGMHLAVFLHEFGHALGFWLSGGTVTAIVMEAPLPAGYVNGTTSFPYLHVWGGVAFGSFMTLVPLRMARRLPPSSSIRFAALMIAAFCLAHNGMYLFIGSIQPFADASNMIALGAPRWLLFLLGIPLLVGFVVVLTPAIRMVGLHPTESLWKWIIVVELGLLPVLALMVTIAVVTDFSESFKWSMVLFGMGYAVCFAFAAYRARSVARSRGAVGESFLLPQRWSITFTLLAGALLLVAGEWLAFGPERSGTGQQWEITVENMSNLPCSFFVTLDTGTMKVEGVAKGEHINLVAGISKTMVRTVKVARGKDEQTLTANLTLLPGQRYAIRVGVDGKLKASVLAR